MTMQPHIYLSENTVNNRSLKMLSIVISAYNDQGNFL